EGRTAKMKNLEIRPGVAMAYEEHCFAPPWSSPQTVVMVHGNAASSRAWTGFVPHLVGKYRVVRPDMPGFGASAEPPGYRWQGGRVGLRSRPFPRRLEYRQMSPDRRQIRRLGRDTTCHRSFGSIAFAFVVRLAGSR
ncbi:MAG: alpha/beta fold hydrolase, partial [Xanthobacteraceae bacterium]